MRFEDEWFCQKCSTGKWWIRTDCRHCSVVTNEAAELPQTSIQEKISILEKTLSGMGNEEPIIAGRRLLEKELERHQKKPQQGDQAHRARGREGGGDAGKNIRVRKETLRVAYEEIQKLRAVQGVKRRAGAPRDATTEEIASWFMEEEVIVLEISGKRKENPRGGREGIHQGRRRDPRREHGRTGWLSVVVKV